MDDNKAGSSRLGQAFASSRLRTQGQLSRDTRPLPPLPLESSVSASESSVIIRAAKPIRSAFSSPTRPAFPLPSTSAPVGDHLSSLKDLPDATTRYLNESSPQAFRPLDLAPSHSDSSDAVPSQPSTAGIQRPAPELGLSRSGSTSRQRKALARTASNGALRPSTADSFATPPLPTNFPYVSSSDTGATSPRGAAHGRIVRRQPSSSDLSEPSAQRRTFLPLAMRRTSFLRPKTPPSHASSVPTGTLSLAPQSAPTRGRTKSESLSPTNRGADMSSDGQTTPSRFLSRQAIRRRAKPDDEDIPAQPPASSPGKGRFLALAPDRSSHRWSLLGARSATLPIAQPDSIFHEQAPFSSRTDGANDIPFLAADDVSTRISNTVWAQNTPRRPLYTNRQRRAAATPEVPVPLTARPRSRSISTMEARNRQTRNRTSTVSSTSSAIDRSAWLSSIGHKRVKSREVPSHSLLAEMPPTPTTARAKSNALFPTSTFILPDTPPASPSASSMRSNIVSLKAASLQHLSEQQQQAPREGERMSNSDDDCCSIEEESEGELSCAALTSPSSSTSSLPLSPNAVKLAELKAELQNLSGLGSPATKSERGINDAPCILMRIRSNGAHAQCSIPLEDGINHTFDIGTADANQDGWRIHVVAERITS